MDGSLERTSTRLVGCRPLPMTLFTGCNSYNPQTPCLFTAKWPKRFFLASREDPRIGHGQTQILSPFEFFRLLELLFGCD